MATNGGLAVGRRLANGGNKMRCLGLSIFLLIACPGAAFSQKATAAANVDEDQICVAIARLWQGSIEETRQIRSVPIPESYRGTLEAGGCIAWQLVRESLLDWHMAYGDEKSAVASIEYLEGRMLAGKSVQADLAVKLAALTGKTSGKHARSRRGDASVDALVETAYGYRSLAMEYARAADFYGSPSLLAKAERLAEPSLAVGLLLRAAHEEREACQVGAQQCQSRQQGTEQLKFDDYQDRKLRELDLQLAVARARVGGAASDFAAAREIFARNDNPYYDTAGEEAYKHGDDFCDIGDASYLSEWKGACDEDNFDARALSYWRYRAVFSALARAAGQQGLRPRGNDWDGETAIRLIEAQESAHSEGLPQSYFGAASHALTDIRFAMAERQYAMARKELEDDPRASNTQPAAHLYHSLDLYWRAAIYAQGTTHPGWLRRIGLRYLEASETFEKVRAQIGPLDPKYARRIAWFRTVLPRLDAMALGEFSSVDRK
jgi:hypothetical protein